ncbi:6784_t:CDS:1, partial [Ambispora leptoticha]
MAHLSRISLENPKVLDILQNDAKDYANESKYITVFVTSEDNAYEDG